VPNVEWEAAKVERNFHKHFRFAANAHNFRVAVTIPDLHIFAVTRVSLLQAIKN
jgi:hypothetical protein